MLGAAGESSSTVYPTCIMNWYDFNSRRRTTLSKVVGCVLKYFKLKEIFSNWVGKKFSPWRTFFSGVLKTFKSMKKFNAQIEGYRRMRFDRNIAWFILILRHTWYRCKNMVIYLCWDFQFKDTLIQIWKSLYMFVLI